MSSIDPRGIDAARAIQIVRDNFADFDTAKPNWLPLPDGKVSLDDLRVVAANAEGKFSPEEAQAAQFLVDSKAARSALDVGAGRGEVDGTISREDADGAWNSVQSGELDQRLLDTAAGLGGADGKFGAQDVAAARQDIAIAQTLKDALGKLPDDLPLQTQVQAALAMHRNADDEQALTQVGTLIDSPAFRGLNEDQQTQALALFGNNTAVSSAARQKLEGLDLNDTASLRKFMLTEARPTDLWRDAAPDSGVADSRRKPYDISGPETTDYEFASGTEPNKNVKEPALKYTVHVDGREIDVIVPASEARDDGKSYPTVDQIAKGLAAQPSPSLAATEKVVVNPYTPKETDKNGQVVDSGADMYATGGSFYVNPHGVDRPRVQKDFDFTFMHETAHLVRQPSGPFGIPMEWNLAVQKDQLFSTHYADDRYVADGGSAIDKDLGIDPGEDFAEAYMTYHLVKGTPDEAQMRALMPERFAILDRMFG
ncbi:hypothetical protein J5226_08055 [Lysobacter sp. K5869]|uniref:hypothetical protein n=1 Tax=Lysobacter sp. K5869 TaxID=2820808 RepID=UPI001C06331A|nr:hypothetical protein [Lysobacter sp. K5869]QWP78332.1 hypothetical protein J5226_08055 [Lysobacter sp. K5869]